TGNAAQGSLVRLGLGPVRERSGLLLRLLLLLCWGPGTETQTEECRHRHPCQTRFHGNFILPEAAQQDARKNNGDCQVLRSSYRKVQPSEYQTRQSGAGCSPGPARAGVWAARLADSPLSHCAPFMILIPSK